MDKWSHSYPDLLADHVWQHWRKSDKDHFCFKTPGTLATFLSYAYQASLLKEEGLGVSCRLALAHPEDLELNKVSPYQYQISRLQVPRRFDEQEIRRMSPAAQFNQAMIAVAWTPESGFRIAGVIQTGQWSRDLVADVEGLIHGIPQWLIVHVRGPGNLVVNDGAERIATLLQGRIEGRGINVFRSSWFRQTCFYDKPGAELRAAVRENSEVELLDDFLQNYDTTFLKQIVRAIRDRRHGGTLVFAKTSMMNHFLLRGGAMRVKYRVDQDRSSSPYQFLVAEVARKVAAIAENHGEKTVGWNDFLRWSDLLPYSLTSRYLDFSHWYADMATVDGCVLLDGNFSIYGYGAEIQVAGSDEEIVYQATCLEADNVEPESAEHAGTRHRTVYRLCRNFKECLVVVVSQDGSVKFVMNHRNRVTYWGQLDF